MLIWFRLRRAGTVLAIGLTSLLAGGSAVFAFRAVGPGWFARFLAAVLLVTFLKLTIFLVGRSRELLRLIKTQQALKVNADLGTRPKMIAPLSEDEKARRTFWKKLFPDDDA